MKEPLAETDFIPSGMDVQSLSSQPVLTQLPQNILQGQLRQGVVPGLPAAFQSGPAPRVIQLRVLTLHWWAAL